MYFGVYLGGPKWTKLIEGVPCSIGRDCIERVPDQRWPAGTSTDAANQAQFKQALADRDYVSFSLRTTF